tara:strand:+ start:754 stop:1038 length:285 start_codon:yes stop_codon:yes gene_type:complete
MKINIWIHKNDIESGTIKDFWNICPQGSRWQDWFQVEVDQDTFVQLEDERREKRMNIIGQNGNDGIHYNIPEGADDGGDADADDLDQDNQPFAD